MQAELETLLARQRDRPLRGFVEREFRAFLACSILAHGFLRVHCDACGHERLIAFSCKGRSFCPSCGGRRMADTAPHLVDRVLPEVPVRLNLLCARGCKFPAAHGGPVEVLLRFSFGRQPPPARRELLVLEDAPLPVVTAVLTVDT